MLSLQAQRLRSIVGAIVCGFLLSLATGVVENSPEASIIGYRFYGYPLVWRVTKTLQPTEFRLINLAIDAAFWIVIALFGLIVLEQLRLRVDFRYETLLLPLVLLVPIGLIIDFVHEFGHAIWGTAVGGRLTYMQIAFFEIYPMLAITPEFHLGYVQVEGLTTKFASGLMSLGGSLTTNIISWLIVLVLLKFNFGHKTQVGLKICGLFSLLDLPLYVFFPQIGLRHWIFLGGYQPEPLIGARNMGIPDPAFYLMAILTTLGLTFLYFKPFWEKAGKRIRNHSRLSQPQNEQNLRGIYQ